MPQDSTILPQSNDIAIAQVRIARPTDRLAEVVKFYRDVLGLPEIARFENHAGYDGVMIGLPGQNCHLEFTHHTSGSPCPAPTRDNLLVFYIAEYSEIERLRNRLRDAGHAEVAPENPYWDDKSLTYEDPDGWRIVLFHGEGLTE